MLGYYDYTVILTYLSALSSIFGMVMTVTGHPIVATLCLLFCGFCDMFDGKVAGTKKNRTAEERAFGIQIDSLSDILAFGVLPAMIFLSLCTYRWYACLIAALYVLAGLIRLAYYNVTEQTRQQETAESRKSYSGLPITSSALIFPIFYCIVSVYCIRYDRIEIFRDLFTYASFRAVLCSLTGVTGLCFLLPFKIRKPQNKEMYFFLGVGVLAAAVLLVFWLRRHFA